MTVAVAAAARRLRGGAALLSGAARRHRIALAIVWLVVVGALASLAFAHELATERYDDVGPVLERFQALPGPALVALLAISMGIAVVFGTTRRRSIAVAVGAIPVAGAGACLGFAFAPKDARWAVAAALGLVAIGVIVLLARGSVARLKELLALGAMALTGSLAPVVIGRAAAASPEVADAAVALVLLATHAFGVLVALLFFGGRPAVFVAPVLEHPMPRAQLAAARTFALILLVPIYLGFDLAEYVRVGDHVRTVARKGLLKGETATILQRELGATPLDSARREIPIQQVVAGVGVLKAPIVCENGRCSGTITLDAHYELLVEPIDIEPKDLAKTIENARLAMTSDAIYIGASAPRDASLRDLFVAIRDRLEARTVHVPLIDLQLGTSRARWALGIIVIAILVLVRNRLGAGLRDGGASDDEPWLLLDTGDGLERAVSAFYFVALVSASSLVTCALALATRSETTRAAALPLGVLWASTTWLSLSVACRILALRARRLASRLAPSVTPPPAGPPAKFVSRLRRAQRP